MLDGPRTFDSQDDPCHPTPAYISAEKLSVEWVRSKKGYTERDEAEIDGS
jgi:hypothetical protein